MTFYVAIFTHLVWPNIRCINLNPWLHGSRGQKGTSGEGSIGITQGQDGKNLRRDGKLPRSSGLRFLRFEYTADLNEEYPLLKKNKILGR